MEEKEERVVNRKYEIEIALELNRILREEEQEGEREKSGRKSRTSSSSSSCSMSIEVCRERVGREISRRDF